ncbi:cytochrome c oxidase assembly factor CtaG [Psychrobacillus sp.]|uniref:cytochrome c oxidase assembly factor CtaG n=1 Tax=Psychrobacillus sp. TaxID=1871623 RepID=UPI0028BED1B5|nr:cytochrome c oxidase assembly factor CtaG [Psychrobacillus sp.]
MAIFYLFDFRSLWSPFYATALIAVLCFYFLITVKYRSRFKDSEPLSKTQALCFCIVIGLFYIIKGSPIDLWSHMMLTMHMIQMAVLVLIIPVLIIKGIPDWVWRVLVYNKFIRPFWSFVTKPLIALVLFNGAFSLYHVPLVLDFSKTNSFYHASIHLLLFVLAICMFWPILNTLKEYKKMPNLLEIGYLFANGVLMLPACALIIFATDPMYSTYSDPESLINALALCATSESVSGLDAIGPEIIEIFNPLELINDQKLGGIIMKIVQEIVYAIILGFLFRDWYRSEQKLGRESDLNAQTY